MTLDKLRSIPRQRWTLGGVIVLLVGAVILMPRDVRMRDASATTPAEQALEIRQEFDRRLTETDPGDVDAQIDLAQWAFMQDLVTQANTVLHEILASQPEHEPAKELVSEIASKGSLPAASTVLENTRQLLPGRFRSYESARFMILSDADDTWTRTQVLRLERAHHQFGRFARRIGLDPLPLKHKLVCVLFQNRDAYATFAREHDGVRADWVAGYYAPADDRVVFYNVESNPDVRNARAQLKEMENDIDGLKVKLRSATKSGDQPAIDALREQLNRYLKHHEDETSRLAAFTDDVAAATTVHEAIHQLLFHTQIQMASVTYPMWISEGMATCFETDAPHSAFGPDHEYKPRRERFQTALDEDSLLPLSELIVMTSLTATQDPGRVNIVYDQSYAFFMWVSRFRRQELVDYLRFMKDYQHQTMSADDQRTVFERAFGSLDRVERKWLHHERADIYRRSF